MKGTVCTDPQIEGGWETMWRATPLSDTGALRRAALGERINLFLRI